MAYSKPVLAGVLVDPPPSLSSRAQRRQRYEQPLQAAPSASKLLHRASVCCSRVALDATVFVVALLPTDTWDMAAVPAPASAAKPGRSADYDYLMSVWFVDSPFDILYAPGRCVAVALGY